MRRPSFVLKCLIASVAPLAFLGASGAAVAKTAPIGAYTTKGAWRFVSAPRLHPPKIRLDMKSKKGLAPGNFLLANFPNLTKTQPESGTAEKMIGQSGPLIVDSRMRPIWFNPVPKNVVATTLKAQTVQGKPALSWWQGVVTNTGQIQSGEDVIVGQNYKTIAKLEGADGWTVTLHDIQVKGDDAWVTANKNIPMDLTPFGGSGVGTMIDVAVQEYDLKTHQLLFNWDAMQHVPLTDTHQPPVGKLWDPYHINSIQLGNGTVLASLRDTWAAYQINTTTGLTEWTLGGKHSTFKFGPGAQFQWQHDVEYHRGGLVSVFDDACCAQTSPGKFAKATGPGRVLVLSLDTTTNTASVAAQYVRNPVLKPAFLGNADLLPNGNVAVGWGSLPYFSEFSKSGKQLLDAVWPGPDLSYRAYVSRWTGKPFFRPSVAARTSHGKTTVYASWDGSTLVSGWRVLAGSSSKHLSPAARVRKNGFETAIRVKKSYKAYEVQALDRHGHVLKTSAVFPKPKGSSGQGGGFY